MPPSHTHSGVYGDSPDLAIAPVSHPPLERALHAACRDMGLTEAYLAALRDPAIGPEPRLLLGVTGSDLGGRRRLATLVAQMLPDELELDLIELEDDSLSNALRECCQAFYRV